MAHALVAAAIDIAASSDAVWECLIDPVKGRIWRNAEFHTDWQPGSPIDIVAYIGAKTYRDKGQVLQVERRTLLAYSFLPGVSGLPDVSESYSIVTARLISTVTSTRLEIEHTVPPSPIRRGKDFEIGPESGEKHVEFYWRVTLPILRDLIEGRDSLALRMAIGSIDLTRPLDLTD